MSMFFVSCHVLLSFYLVIFVNIKLRLGSIYNLPPCCGSITESNKTEPEKLYSTGFNDELYSILQKEMAGNERFPLLHCVPIIDHFGFFYSEAF